MTPAQAGEALAQRSAQFAAQQTAPVSTPEQVQDAHDAELRLAKLTCDPIWMRKFTQGSRAERLEYEQLTQAIAAGADDGHIRVGDVETTMEGGVRRQDLIGAIEDLSKIGIPEEGIIRTLTADFSDEDIEWAQRELDRGMATKEWTDALLRGDPTVLHEFTALCAVVAAGKAA
jgi:hypothetical protein